MYQEDKNIDADDLSQAGTTGVSPFIYSVESQT